MGYCSFNTAGSAAIVAVVNEIVGDWTAYIGGAGPHIREADLREAVATEGEKMSRSHAEVIFPWLAEKYEWRD